MLRLASRLLQTTDFNHKFYDVIRGHINTQIQKIKGSHVVIADAASDEVLMGETAVKVPVDCVSLPFQTIFIETDNPHFGMMNDSLLFDRHYRGKLDTRVQIGWLVEDLFDSIQGTYDRIKHRLIRFTEFTFNKRDGRTNVHCSAEYFTISICPEESELIYYSMYQPRDKHSHKLGYDFIEWDGGEIAGWRGFGSIAVPLKVIAMMNCKNVTQVDATQEIGPCRKWLKRQKQSEIRYHILKVTSRSKNVDVGEHVKSEVSVMPRHICRGHFANYTKDNPLFGKYEGRFWVPAHVRGNIQNGIVDKDYRI